MISILVATGFVAAATASEKVRAIDRTYTSKFQKLMEWRDGQLERIEREHAANEAKAEAAKKAADEQHAAFLARTQSRITKMRKERAELDAEIEAALRG